MHAPTSETAHARGADKALKQDATFTARLADLGAEAVPLAKANPEALHTHLQAEIKKWEPVIKKAGVYAD